MPGSPMGPNISRVDRTTACDRTGPDRDRLVPKRRIRTLREIALDPKGYVFTGSDLRLAGHWSLERDPYLLETSVPGIFACGDVRLNPVKRVGAAVGEGSMTIAPFIST